MSEWKARRFWTRAGTRPTGEAGWEVTLDDKPLRTPGKLPLLLPTEELARAVAEEWDAQADVIAPLAMPLTRAANSAVERVAPRRSAVAAMLLEYGRADLLCYRAEGPQTLVLRQYEGWDPLLDWAAEVAGTRLIVTEGVVHVTQPDKAVAGLAARVSELDLWALTALHDLVTLPGSLILGLAVLAGRIDADEAHRLSRLDEEYQAEQWGRDAEADAAAEERRGAMRVAERLYRLSRTRTPAGQDS